MPYDVFYLGDKPNAHPLERFAESIAHARYLSRTENFWIIHELCDYTGFDWEFDFDLLPDDEVWTKDHTNVWPSQHQKDSGTWLCSKEKSDIVVYRTDVTPVQRKSVRTKHWVIKKKIDEYAFDFSWHPDSSSPPYVYHWGTKYVRPELASAVEYHCENAVGDAYMDDTVLLLPGEEWKTLITVEAFDYQWEPDPTEPPFIYVWGNQWNSAVDEPTIEYHVPGAIDRKYMKEVAQVLPESDRWKTLLPVSDFDFTWRPHPTEPPFIYVWGNQWNSAVDEPTVEYHVPGAIDRKYMDTPATVSPSSENWSNITGVIQSGFDFSWRPNPHEEPRIYKWVNDGPIYTVPGASVVVFMEHMTEAHIGVDDKPVSRYHLVSTLEDLVDEHPDEIFWVLNPDIDYKNFDFAWRPPKDKQRFVASFGTVDSKDQLTYFVNGPAYTLGYRDFNYVTVEDHLLEPRLTMFFVDRSNPESSSRYEQLKSKHPNIQKTRFVSSWVDTINRCTAKSQTKLFWVLNSELDYTNFTFDYYPSKWQMTMVHMFGTQWSRWGTTFLVNRDTFPENTKYVKVIEHLSMINFVRAPKATMTQQYDVALIDFGNNHHLPFTPKYVVPFRDTYQDTLQDLMKILPVKRDWHVWVCSSVCDYADFDFTYVPDPFARGDLHVFPSGSQKFGDTFLLNPNVTEIKLNYNGTLRAKRLPEPVITVDSDTVVDAIQATTFTFPYARFVTGTNHPPVTPYNLWEMAVQVESTGGTDCLVPACAKTSIHTEVYDYPKITKAAPLRRSTPMDVVFLSNGESCAEENYQHLVSVVGSKARIHRVEGVNGRVQAYHAVAKASTTPWVFTVFAKLRVDQDFPWDYQPDRLQQPKHYIFHARNPVNGLEYGHQAMILYNSRLTLANTGHGLDFTLDDLHAVEPILSGVATFNTDPWAAWRTAFRECVKLRANDDDASKVRLNTWMTVADGDYAEWVLRGAADAVSFYSDVAGDPMKLRQSYEWDWLNRYFTGRYPGAQKT